MVCLRLELDGPASIHQQPPWTCIIIHRIIRNRHNSSSLHRNQINTSKSFIRNSIYHRNFSMYLLVSKGVCLDEIFDFVIFPHDFLHHFPFVVFHVFLTRFHASYSSHFLFSSWLHLFDFCSRSLSLFVCFEISCPAFPPNSIRRSLLRLLRALFTFSTTTTARPFICHVCFVCVCLSIALFSPLCLNIWIFLRLSSAFFSVAIIHCLFVRAFVFVCVCVWAWAHSSVLYILGRWTFIW